MMMSDSGEPPRQTPMRPHGVITTGLHPTNAEQQEQLPCPRCESTHTKFCYYNNYNFSQPRHFCKSCRRYWTRGGTLRDIPVGGGTRKAAKRSRTCSSSSSTVGTSSAPLQATPVLFPQSSTFNGVTVTAPVENEGKGNALSLSGSFTSLLNHNAAYGTGSVIGIGLGSSFDDVSFVLGRAVWPFSTVGDSSATNNVGSNGGGHHGVAMPYTWQFEGLESSNAGEYFGWPDLSITTPGNSLK